MSWDRYAFKNRKTLKSLRREVGELKMILRSGHTCSICESVKEQCVDLQGQVEELQRKYNRAMNDVCDLVRDEIERKEFIDKIVQENKDLKASLHDVTNSQGGDSA